MTNFPFKEDISDNRQWGKSVCFVGGVVPQWMHHNIVKSLGNTDSRYELAGKIVPESYINDLKATGFWDRVDYYGRIEYKDLFPFLQKSSAGLIIRTYGYPNSGYTKGSLGCNKFFEYMMAGIPLIASNMEDWAAIINRFKCGLLVDPDDAGSISNAINFIINNPDKAKEMGDNGKKAAMEYYHWGTQEKILFEIYNQVLTSNK